MNSLAPAHVADLRKSGLDDAVIETLGFCAVRPKEIPVKAAESAYRIHYFDLAGKPNGFYRLKLDPPVTDAQGHKLKYWQPPGSAPHLYCPPLLSWQAVARNPQTVLTITEGEKKAACACQRGLITAAVGGVWCWASTLDSGDKLVLPMLDEFVWTNRLVLLCPDSDAWHEGKEHAILAGFFALAKELQQRGATVHFVVLPDLHGARAGLDDWLLVPGNENPQSWDTLDRLPLDHPRFHALSAWWQRWKERQVTAAAIKDREPAALDVTEAAGLYTVASAQHGVRIIFDRLTEARGDVRAELTVRLGQTELLSGVDLGLKSDTGHTKLAGSLKGLMPAIPWKLLLQRACALVLKRHREGEPLRSLTIDTPVEPLTYQVSPLVFRGKPSVMFGDGGVGKSTYALLCAMLVSTGETVAGLSALPGIPLILDYEDSYEVHVRRMQAIAACHPNLKGADVRYQACTEPLPSLTHTLLRRIQTEGITFLVLDSLAAAVGGDAGAEAATKVFRAIRSLGVGALILAHVPKPSGDTQTEPSIYGSVFNKNFARSTWEIRKEQDLDSDQSILGLFNRKSNLARLHHPIGLKVTQNAASTAILYEPFDLSAAAELATALPLPSRIRTLLEDLEVGESRSAKEIAEALDAKLPTVKAILSKHGGSKWRRVGEFRDARWAVL